MSAVGNLEVVSENVLKEVVQCDTGSTAVSEVETAKVEKRYNWLMLTPSAGGAVIWKVWGNCKVWVLPGLKCRLRLYDDEVKPRFLDVKTDTWLFLSDQDMPEFFPYVVQYDWFDHVAKGDDYVIFDF